jgi:pimeloyl-ACP methyl ester carboxylesterase
MTDDTAEMYRYRADALSTDVGAGPPVVLSHGTLMDRTMFAPQLEALSADYRVVAYDNRARTDRWMGPYDLVDLADDAAALMDAKGIEECVLGGMSMGGFMALRFALRHPDRLRGLVLVDSMAAAHTEAEREEYRGMIALSKAAGRMPDDVAEAVSGLLFGATTNEERPDLVGRWTDRWQTYPPEAVEAEVESWLDRPDLTHRLDEIDVPVLVVHGEEDAALGIERAEPMVEALPDARMERIPEAGHSSNLERPGPVDDAVRSFLADVY